MSMNQLHRIKEMQRKQLGPYQIAKELQIDPKTVKYNGHKGTYQALRLQGKLPAFYGDKEGNEQNC